MRSTHFSDLTIEQVQDIVRRELSTASRVRYLVLLLVTLTAAALLGLLWLTEPSPLPMRTHLAFGLLLVINLAWSALAAWVLTRRKVLYAMHQVIAAWMALTASGVFLLFGATIAIVRANAMALVSIGFVGVVWLLAAITMLRRARRRRRQLLARRDELSNRLSHLQ